jgi:hypothetical protein
MRERGQANRDYYNGLFDTQGDLWQGSSACRDNERILLANSERSQILFWIRRLEAERARAIPIHKRRPLVLQSNPDAFANSIRAFLVYPIPL